MKPKRTHLELTSGAYLDYMDPRPEDIHLSDIGLALSNACRWAGHCPAHFSVAEHACLVQDIVREWGGGIMEQLGALHHDDHEAYVGDVPTPLKTVMGDAYYRLAERLDAAIARRLVIDPAYFSAPIVKEADRLALFVEAAAFKPSRGEHWDGRPEVVELPGDLFGRYNELRHPLRPDQARQLYLARHEGLVEKLYS